MMEVTNVLKGTSGLATLASVAKLKHTLAKKDDQEGDEAAIRDWGVSVAEEGAIPPNLKSAMVEVVLSVNEVQRLATEDRNEGFSTKNLSTECALRMDLKSSARWTCRSTSGTLTGTANLCSLSF
jgi:hypothetical protein